MKASQGLWSWAWREAFRPLLKYAVFSGRASRAEIWLFTLLIVVGFFLCALVEWLVLGWPPVSGPDVLAVAFSLAMFVPSMSVTTRRLHDIDRSGWWQLILFIPIVGFLVVLYWSVLPGMRITNRFGPPPRRRSTSREVQA